MSSFYVLYGVTFKLSVTSLCRKIKKIARYRTFFSPNLFLRLLMIYYAVKCPHLYPGIRCSLLNLFIIISKSMFQKYKWRKTRVLSGESDLLQFLQHQVVSGTPWISQNQFRSLVYANTVLKRKMSKFNCFLSFSLVVFFFFPPL